MPSTAPRIRQGAFRRSVVPALAAAFCSLLLAASAPATETSFWKVDAFEEFKAGSLQGTSVLEDGTVVISPPIEMIDVPDAQYVWRAGFRGGDELIYAAGTPGFVCEQVGGECRELMASDTSDFPAFAVSQSGDIYVGSSPGGEVYRIREGADAELLFESEQGYVWSMAYSEEHGLLVGTGDLAKVYAVDDDGEAEVIYSSTEASISALFAGGGRVLAGTSIGGLLLDITPGTDVRVIYDAPYEEISGIVLGGDGRVYFSATTVAMDEVIDENALYETGYGSGAVYATTDGGGATELWHSMDAPITSLGESADGTIMAGTGARGLLYSMAPQGGADLVAELDGEMVLSLTSSDDGLAAALGLPGGIALIGTGAASTGSYESDVLNARSAATWGELSWRADEPAGSEVSLSVRSGNTEYPDDTWSDWWDVDGKRGGPIECPGARYLQWRATLSRGSGSGPVLRSVEVAYLRENLPPRVGSVTVFEPGDVVTGPAGGGDGTTVSQTLPGGIEVTYSLDARPSDRSLPVLIRGLRTVSWEAVDPNGDALSCELWVRAEDETEWRKMEDDIRWRTLHTWDTQSMADGIYRLKVVASDRPGNPVGGAGEGSAVSAPFLVDNGSPEIVSLDAERKKGMLIITGEARDVLSPLTFVDVAIDYGAWQMAFAADGLFDSRSEGFRLELPDPGPGEHTVAVRATDRAGNIALRRRVAG